MLKAGLRDVWGNITFCRQYTPLGWTDALSCDRAKARFESVRTATALATSTSLTMPHVELLPNSSSAIAPGWTYVVDTGYDPSKIAINPKNKKRVAAQQAGLRGENELSSRQQTAIARRIAELNRDNDPKQSIPIPGKTCRCIR